jgi:small subunit ribosomal protein S17
MTDERGNRRTKQGVVVGNKMAKTVVVQVERRFRHPRYDKIVTKARKYYAHHENEELAIGDKVTIVETRPLSKLKRWRVMAREG